jgi:hypothetical protein
LGVVWVSGVGADAVLGVLGVLAGDAVWAIAMGDRPNDKNRKRVE